MSKPIVIDYNNCPSNDLDKEFELVCNEEKLDFTKICKFMKMGIPNKVIDLLIEKTIIYQQCGACLRINFWKGDARVLKNNLTLLRAYDMNGWSTDDNAFVEYGDKVFDHTQNDFGYELLQWGKYIVLISGFSA